MPVLESNNLCIREKGLHTWVINWGNPELRKAKDLLQDFSVPLIWFFVNVYYGISQVTQIPKCYVNTHSDGWLIETWNKCHRTPVTWKITLVLGVPGRLSGGSQIRTGSGHMGKEKLSAAYAEVYRLGGGWSVCWSGSIWECGVVWWWQGRS